MPGPSDLIPNPFDSVRDLVISELVEETIEKTTGKTKQELLADMLREAGFEPSVSPDAEFEYKSTASKPGAGKVKKVLGGEAVRRDSLALSVLGFDLQGGSEVEVKAVVVEASPTSASGELNVVELEVEGWLARFDTDMHWSAGPRSSVGVLAPLVFQAPFPFAARVGDPMVHGGVAGPGPGSPDVLVGGRAALRAFDSHACPAATPNPHGPGFFVSAATDVLVNGRPLMRAGDYALESVGPNPVAGGCLSVLCGPPAPPLSCHAVKIETRALVQWDGEAGVDFGYGIAKVKAGLGIDAKGVGVRASGEADGSAVRPWFKGTGSLNIPIGIDVDLPFLGRVRRDYLQFSARPEVELRVITLGADGSLQPGERPGRDFGFAPVRLGKWKFETTTDLQEAKP